MFTYKTEKRKRGIRKDMVMSDKITRKRILAYLYDIFKTTPSTTKSTDEIAVALGILHVEAKGALIYLHQKGLIDSFPNRFNDDWNQKINADGIDELEKLESELIDTNSSHVEIPKDDFQGIMKVFISHKFETENQKLALILRKALRSKKIDGYLAESKREYELLIGEKIRQAINETDYVVGIITKESENSASVNQELGYALGKDIPIVIMIEQNLTHGVLTHGRETEEFTRPNFEKHCNNIVEYILEKRNKKKLSNDVKIWLKENVYISLYDKIVKLHNNPDKFSYIQSDPWKELEPSAKLRLENDVKDILQQYSDALDNWKIMISNLTSIYVINQHHLGNIIKPAFDKVSLTMSNGYIILDERSSQEPRQWLDAFKFIMFDDTITSPEILYEKLLNYAKLTGNGHQPWLLRWKSEKPDLYTYIFQTLPQLRTELRIDHTNNELSQQKKIVQELGDKVVRLLEDKIK